MKKLFLILFFTTSLVWGNATNTPTNTATNSPTMTPTNTPTNTPTATNTPTISPTNSPTNTPTITPTNSSTNSPSNSPTKSPTNSPTNTPTNTLTWSPTKTTTNTATNSPTNTPTPTWTASISPTSVPPPWAPVHNPIGNSYGPLTIAVGASVTFYKPWDAMGVEFNVVSSDSGGVSVLTLAKQDPLALTNQNSTEYNSSGDMALFYTQIPGRVVDVGISDVQGFIIKNSSTQIFIISSYNYFTFGNWNGQFVHSIPYNTPTGSFTPTVTNTPTVLGYQITSVDSLAGPATFYTGGRMTINWTIWILPSTAAPSSAQSILVEPGTSNGVIYQLNNGKFYDFHSVGTSGTNFNALFTNDIYPSAINFMAVYPKITPTQTQVLTIIFYPVFTTSDLPEKYRHLFEPGYDLAHGFRIYWKVCKTEGMKIYYKPAFVKAG